MYSELVMALIITDIKSDISETTDQILKKALKKVSLSERDISKAEIYKTSLDARKRNDIHFVHSVYLDLRDSKAEKNICQKNYS